MTMKVECFGCGQDCSHAYGTYLGYPYHIGCMPMKPRRRREPEDDHYSSDGDRLDGPLPGFFPKR